MPIKRPLDLHGFKFPVSMYIKTVNFVYLYVNIVKINWMMKDKLQDI